MRYQDCTIILFKLTATLFMLLSGIAHADAYFSDRNGVIYLTDNPVDENFDVIATAPVAEVILAPAGGDVSSIQTQPANGSHSAYAEVVAGAARRSGVDSNLIHAVIKAESNYNPKAVSAKGAIGMMQLMPATAKVYGAANPYDPVQNIAAGTRYLSYLMTLFRNDLHLVLAAYNAGEGTVSRYGNRVPPFPETITYVRKVLSDYQVRNFDAIGMR